MWIPKPPPTPRELKGCEALPTVETGTTWPPTEIQLQIPQLNTAILLASGANATQASDSCVKSK